MCYLLNNKQMTSAYYNCYKKQHTSKNKEQRVVSVNLTADCTSRKNATIVQSPNRLHTTATKSIRKIGEIGTWIWDCKS